MMSNCDRVPGTAAVVYCLHLLLVMLIREDEAVIVSHPSSRTPRFYPQPVLGTQVKPQVWKTEVFSKDVICLALHIEKLTVASKWRMDCWAEAGRAMGMRAWGVGTGVTWQEGMEAGIRVSSG